MPTWDGIRNGVAVSATLALLLCGCGLKADTGTAAEGNAGDEAAPTEGSTETTTTVAPELSDTTWKRNVQLRGAYAYALEGSAFLACGSNEYWWTDFEGVALERFQEVAADLGCEERGCLFSATGTADVSPPGRYGESGRYPRSVVFTRLTSFSRTTLVTDPVAANRVGCELR
jgi:hypothetical protein